MDTAKWLKIDRDTLNRLNSPLDITLLNRFASQDEHKPGEPIWEIMHMIGEDLVNYVTSLRTRLDFVAQNAVVWDLDNFKVLFMPRTDPLSDETCLGLGYHIERLGLENEVLALVYPDSRGKGYGMRRYKDDTRMEFTLISDEPDVHFTHARGFIAKTSSTDQARLKDLLLQSFIASQSFLVELKYYSPADTVSVMPPLQTVPLKLSHYLALYLQQCL